MDEDELAVLFATLTIYLGLPLLFLSGSWVIQRLIIRSRRKRLLAQEAYFRERIRTTNLKHFPAENCSAPALVTGTAVIANNYFASFVSLFRLLFGGEMKSYTGMCSDARRLALVRMLQEAEKLGANEICNVRFETVSICSGEESRKAGGVELIVYGTAFKRNLP